MTTNLPDQDPNTRVHEFDSPGLGSTPGRPGAASTVDEAREGPAGPAFTVVVRGHPAPQGSKRHVGRGILVESSKHVKPWRDAVRSDAVRAELAIPAADREGVFPLDGPLRVDMVFTAARPKSHYRTGRNAALLRDDAPLRPTGAPDLSKLARSTEDALTDAGIWRDDSRVVEYGRLAKVYAGEDVDALDVPGAVVRIWPVTS